jgi:probable addiction module antidote protein
MDVKVTPFDAAEFLDRDSSKEYLINDALRSGDARYVAAAIGAVARASGGLSFLERRTGIKRQTLNKAFSNKGNPTLETLMIVLPAMGLKLQVGRLEAAGAETAAPQPQFA